MDATHENNSLIITIANNMSTKAQVMPCILSIPFNNDSSSTGDPNDSSHSISAFATSSTLPIILTPLTHF